MSEPLLVMTKTVSRNPSSTLTQPTVHSGMWHASTLLAWAHPPSPLGWCLNTVHAPRPPAGAPLLLLVGGHGCTGWPYGSWGPLVVLRWLMSSKQGSSWAHWVAGATPVACWWVWHAQGEPCSMAKGGGLPLGFGPGVCGQACSLSPCWAILAGHYSFCFLGACWFSSVATF